MGVAVYVISLYRIDTYIIHTVLQVTNEARFVVEKDNPCSLLTVGTNNDKLQELFCEHLTSLTMYFLKQRGVGLHAQAMHLLAYKP